LLYLSFIYLHGEWRDVTPRRGDIRDGWEMIKFYLFLRRDHPPQAKHNALQRGAYFAMPIIGAALVITGLAIWKPVQLAFLTNLLGGYVWARYWHFVAMFLLVLASIVHVFMVIAVDPHSLRSMLTGNYDPTKSPERRNARPFRRSNPVAQESAHEST
jgi:thiosulfate reductase cytochrome b subunit